MAQDSTKVIVGAAVVRVGAYVTAGAAGSLVEVGHTASPTTLSSSLEFQRFGSEQAIGDILVIPIGAQFQIKVDIMEVVAENLRVALAQITAQKSGSSPNETIKITDPVEQYHQVAIVGVGPGTNRVRTITAWRCSAGGLEPISFGKKELQKYTLTFNVLRDDSISGANPARYFQQVDT